MNVETTRPKGGLTALAGNATLVVAVFTGCDPGIPDDARLSTLSRHEVMDLCDELEDAVEADFDTKMEGYASVMCDGEREVSLGSPSASFCRNVDVSYCEATAGDVRACSEAVHRDVCGAALQSPAACAPLLAGGCEPGITASRVVAWCRSADPLSLLAVEGIYELTSHTQNIASCDVQGASVLESDSERFVVVIEMHGTARAVSCADPAGCRLTADMLRDTNGSVDRIPAFDGQFSCQALGSNELTGDAQDVTAVSREGCGLSRIAAALTRSPDGGVRIEARTWELPGPGNCVGWGPFDARDGATCSLLEVIEGRPVAAPEALEGL